MRSEFKKVHGGDVVQVLNYVKYLEELGNTCKLVGRFPKEEFDVYIIVNIDRPIEVYSYYRHIKRKNKPFFVVPIHHPIDAVSKYEIEIRGGVGGLLASIVPDFYKREKIKNISRFVKRKWYLKLIFMTMFLDYKKVIKNVIENAECVFCISNQEKREIANRFNVEFKSKIVRNGVDITNDVVHEAEERNFDLVVVGRIEERKNQISIIKAMSAERFNIVFVGAMDRKPTPYQNEFLKLVNANERLIYKGKLSQKELFSLYSNCKVLVNASFFEVSPLVDIEAALFGCRVVSTQFGYTSENICDVKLVNPYCIESINSVCKEALVSSDIKHHIDTKVLSWKRTSQVIHDSITALG
ncbi:glycosyltransferase [Vibrio fortis]|uniref:glycosyltransferase n=1 Tax=Vibrio fortis TaxID=212667 RepID=UPI0021C4B639|nr:glycosyltransferase [Vibrio fortis]